MNKPIRMWHLVVAVTVNGARAVWQVPLAPIEHLASPGLCVFEVDLGHGPLLERSTRDPTQARSELADGRTYFACGRHWCVNFTGWVSPGDRAIGRTFYPSADRRRRIFLANTSCALSHVSRPRHGAT